jgi:hypothetical protein
VIESPSGRSPEKAPRWDLTGTEACGGGKVFLWMLLVVWEYLGIYTPKDRVRGASRDPQGRGRATPRGAPGTLAVASGLLLLGFQVLRMSSGPRKIIVNFYSVWTPFDIPFLRNSKTRKK